MSEKFNNVRAGLAARIKDLRRDHQTVLSQPIIGRGRRLHWELRDKVRPTQSQLMRLVPLYRACVAMVQQPAGGKAEVLYRRQFHSLQHLLASLASGYDQRESPFVTANASLQLLVPDARLSPVLWATKSVRELFDHAVEQLAADRRQCQANAKQLADARGLFLSSLSSDQQTLMKAMLKAAKLKGNRAVSFREEDLPA